MISYGMSPILGLRYSPLDAGLFLDSTMKTRVASLGSISSFKGSGIRFNHLNIFNDVLPIAALYKYKSYNDYLSNGAAPFPLTLVFASLRLNKVLFSNKDSAKLRAPSSENSTSNKSRNDSPMLTFSAFPRY